MAQCVGRNQRTGERCGRSAAAGADTCYYHGPRAAAGAARRRTPSPGTNATRLTTKVLSKRTWSDFEELFAAGTGWGRCACLFALDAKRATRGGTWADQREVNLGTMRGLVDEGRAHGVLVYDEGTPIGWCQFVAQPHLRARDETTAEANWFITCFVVEPVRRGRGVTAVALRAAISAIARRGGGVVEGWATAVAPGAPPRSERKDLHVDGDVLFWGGTGKVDYGVEVDGVGPVAALYRTGRSMHGAPLGGTVDVFQRVGFRAVRVLPRGKSALADRIVMRRTV